MIATLGNSELTVEIDDLGAELSRIHSADGCQYLWPGDPAIWPERSPLLFPIVGGLWGDTYRLDGRAYELGRHGFARKMGFELHDLSDRQATYVLTDSPRTRSVYPFGFRLEVRYTLEGGCITVDYRLTHPESVPLPFSIGAHPGFLCQWQAGDTLEDYYLEWENAETAEAHVLQNGYLSDELQRVFDGGRKLPLSAGLFKRAALVFTDHLSRCVRLRRRDDSRFVEVEFKDFPYLGIWSRSGAPFVCIEPWFGFSDPVGYTGDFKAKPGIQILAPGAVFSCTHRIRMGRK
jgi:galactose mutarotase-like enzyme